MRSTAIKAFVGVTTALLVFAACSGGGTGATSAPQTNQPIPPGGSGASTAPGSSTGPVAGGAGAESTLNLRIANFISQVGTAGPALDVYDDALTATQSGGPTPVPLVSNVAFGAVSAYFHPHVPADGGYIHLWALKAGENPTTDAADAGAFFVGANDVAQATIVLTYDGQGPLSSAPPLSAIDSLSFSSILEKGGGATFSGATASLPAIPTAGDGMFLADDANIPGNLAGSNYLMIDDSCAAALNGPSDETGIPHIFASGTAAIVSPYALFPATAGSHQVSVVAFDTGSEPACKDLTAKQGTTTVQLTAGEEALTFVYGTGATDLHLAIAPIAP
jgi:hypothetical protein